MCVHERHLRLSQKLSFHLAQAVPFVSCLFYSIPFDAAPFPQKPRQNKSKDKTKKGDYQRHPPKKAILFTFFQHYTTILKVLLKKGGFLFAFQFDSFFSVFFFFFCESLLQI